MSYREEYLKTFEDALRSYSVSELSIRKFMFTLTTGFDAGTLVNADESLQRKMIENILYDEVVN